MKHRLCFIGLLLIGFSLLAQEKNDTKATKWLNLADYDKSAKALVQNKKTEWGLSEKTSFSCKNDNPKTDKLGFKHYRFAQLYNGIKVEGARWLVHEKNGIATRANGHLVKDLNLSTIPSLSEEQALQYALNVVNAEIWAWEADAYETVLREEDGNATFYPKGELVIVSPDFARGNASAESYHLRYKFDAFIVEPLSRDYIYVDAQNGDIITSLNLIKITISLLQAIRYILVKILLVLQSIEATTLFCDKQEEDKKEKEDEKEKTNLLLTMSKILFILQQLI